MLYSWLFAYVLRYDNQSQLNRSCATTDMRAYAWKLFTTAKEADGGTHF